MSLNIQNEPNSAKDARASQTTSCVPSLTLALHRPGTTLRSLVSLRRWHVDWAPPAMDNGWMGRLSFMKVVIGTTLYYVVPLKLLVVTFDKRETGATLTRL